MSDYFFITDTESSINTVDTDDYIDVKWDYKNDKPVYKNGEFVLVSGIEAVKSWAYRALRTRRYSCPCNSWRYGNDTYMLIGQPWHRETKLAEIKRYTQECLSQNPYITSISDFNADFNGDIVHIEFILNTVYGTDEVDIDL